MLFKTAVIFLVTSFIVITDAQKCHATSHDFDRSCTNELNGVREGARCFFVGEDRRNWAAAWDYCKHRSGAVLAQIHTQKEFEKIRRYLMEKYPEDTSAVMIALRIDPTSTAPSSDDYSWFIDAQNSLPTLKAGNSWIRKLQRIKLDEENVKSHTARCSGIIRGYSFVFDLNCSIGHRFLCQYNNMAQDFQSTGHCIREIPIEVLDIPNKQKCADACSERSYCRGFNISKNVTTCELFARSLIDGEGSDCPPTIPASDDCRHFESVGEWKK